MSATSEKKNVDMLCAAMQAVTPKERAMKHTPGPWHWGDGWKELESDPRDPRKEYTGPKYADIALHSPDLRTPIIPIRIDHYEVEWDSPNDLFDLTPANRALLAAAPELLDGGKRLIQLLHSFVDLYANAAAKKLLESNSVQTLKAAIAKAEGGEP